MRDFGIDSVGRLRDAVERACGDINALGAKPAVERFHDICAYAVNRPFPQANDSWDVDEWLLSKALWVGREVDGRGMLTEAVGNMESSQRTIQMATSEEALRRSPSGAWGGWGTLKEDAARELGAIYDPTEAVGVAVEEWERFIGKREDGTDGVARWAVSAHGKALSILTSRVSSVVEGRRGFYEGLESDQAELARWVERTAVRVDRFYGVVGQPVYRNGSMYPTDTYNPVWRSIDNLIGELYSVAGPDLDTGGGILSGLQERIALIGQLVGEITDYGWDSEEYIRGVVLSDGLLLSDVAYGDVAEAEARY